MKPLLKFTFTDFEALTKETAKQRMPEARLIAQHFGNISGNAHKKGDDDATRKAEADYKLALAIQEAVLTICANGSMGYDVQFELKSAEVRGHRLKI